MRRLVSLSAILFVLVSDSATAGTGFVVTPARVAAGGVVRVSAAASPCLVGDQVSLISRAFRGHAFGGEGAVTSPVRVRGAFSVAAPTRAGLAPGRYEITARCGGGNLPVVGVFRVVSARHVSFAVYLVRGEVVAPVRRTAADTSGVARAAIAALLRGPTAAERRAGYSTQIPAGTRLRGVALAGGVLTVDLTKRFEVGGGSVSMLLRTAQVVYTATRFQSVERVAFRLDGKPVEAIGGEGVVVSAGVGRADFERQAPAILVEQPLPGDRVSSPVLVRGTADVFEAQFLVDVTTPGGTLLAHRTVHASAGSGVRGTFLVRVPLNVGPGRVVVVAYDRSPKNGERIDVVRMPVTLR